MSKSHHDARVYHFFECDRREKWVWKNEMGFAVARFKFDYINIVTRNFA